MLASVLLAAALAPAAPVPKFAPTGPAPYLLSLDAADGKVTATVLRTETIKVKVPEVKVGPDGKPVVAEVEKEVPQQMYKKVPLAELKDLKIATAGGKEVKADDAAKQIADGATVVASADGRAVDAKYLKLFKDDVLVLVSPELAPTASPYGNPWGTYLLPYIEPGNLFPPMPPMPPLPPQPVPPPLPVTPVFPGSDLPPKK